MTADRVVIQQTLIAYPNTNSDRASISVMVSTFSEVCVYFVYLRRILR
jgi:hypothetical protein